MKKSIKNEKVKTAIYTVCALTLCGASLIGFYESNKNNDKAVPIKNETTKEFVTEKVTNKKEIIVNDKVLNVPDDRITTTEAETMPPVYFSFPLENGISKDFSKGELVKNKTTGDWRTHKGADFNGVLGDPVKSICNGTVTEISDDALWGTTVTIDHGNGLTAIYKGLSKGTTVNPGDKIKANDKVGELGEIPIEKDDGVHLHLELYKNGTPVSPKDYIGKTVKF